MAAGLTGLGYGTAHTRTRPAHLAQPTPPEDEGPTIGPISLVVGDRLRDLALEDLHGRKVSLAPLDGRPVVIEFSSATCPICVGGQESMRSVARRYAGRADFFFVYCRAAHRPARRTGGFIRDGQIQRQATTAGERRQGAALLRRAVEPARRLLVDGFGKESLYEQLFGGSGADDALVVVGADGRVALVSRWADADEVENYLKRASHNLGTADAAAAAVGGRSPLLPVELPGKCRPGASS